VSCFHQPSIKRDEGDRLSQLPLQVQTARELDGIARAQRMSQEQSARISRDLRNHLDDGKGGHVALEGGQYPVAA